MMDGNWKSEGDLLSLIFLMKWDFWWSKSFLVARNDIGDSPPIQSKIPQGRWFLRSPIFGSIQILILLSCCYKYMSFSQIKTQIMEVYFKNNLKAILNPRSAYLCVASLHSTICQVKGVTHVLQRKMHISIALGIYVLSRSIDVHG